MTSLSDINIIKEKISDAFPSFGVNKKQQTIRLVYEIAKREQKSPSEIISGLKAEDGNFSQIKSILLKRRYPNLSDDERNRCYPLAELKLNEDDRVELKEKLEIYPKRIFAEKDVLSSDLFLRMQDRFPEAEVVIIDNYKKYIKDRDFTLKDFNERAEDFYVVREEFSFFQQCPCTLQAVCCNYHIMNAGFGCAYECAYCFLPSYTNSPGIIFPENIDDYFKEFNLYEKRIGSGQFTDSLIFDDVTGYSLKIINFFKEHPDNIFEFKTKSVNIDNLLKAPASKNIHVSWSVNPQNIIDEAEFYTTSLVQRINAAKRCVSHGYKVGFHFDPIIWHEGWEHNYKKVIDDIFANIPPEKIGCISLGCLRMTVKQKQVIETRFPNIRILDGEFIPGYDDKLRYCFALRKDIYKNMLGWIRDHSQDVWVYLCMESDKMYKEVFQ